jgi:hypothetical protein
MRLLATSFTHHWRYHFVDAIAIMVAAVALALRYFGVW